MNLSLPTPCPNCRYDLRGLLTDIGAQCPECGGHFTLAQIAQGRSRTMRNWLLSLACTPLIIAAVALASFYLMPSPVIFPLQLLPSPTAGFCWIFFFERHANILSPGPNPTRRERIYITMCAALMAFILTSAAVLVAYVGAAVVLIAWSQL